MASFNLFSNIDHFDEGNCSFGESNIDIDDVVIELPEEKSSPAAVKSKKTKGEGKGRAKLNRKEKCSDLYTPDETVAVVPGVGQKTAFKKLSKLKESLASTSVKDPVKLRSREAMNAAIQQDYETKRAKKRSRLSEIDEVRFVDESPLVQQSIQSANTNDSFDDDELTINIKIKWEGSSKVERIEFCLYKTFNELIDQLSKRDKIDARSLLLMFGNDVIKPSDSPHSIGYTLGKFIAVRVVNNPHLYVSASASQTQISTIEVKIQSSQWKKPMVCNIKLTDQFKVLTGMCAEKLKCHPNKIRFKFDGDILSITSTPDELDFEGGEIIDLLMSD